MNPEIYPCPKCKQTVPLEAKFCPFCGIDLASPVANDYTQCSFAELLVHAKRIEVNIMRDERTIEQLHQKIRDGSFKLKSRKRITNMGRTVIIETIKKDILGYKWNTGGYFHPLLEDLVRIKEELSRRERIEEYQHLEKFIHELQAAR